MLAAKNSSNIGEYLELLNVRLAGATSTNTDSSRSRYRAAISSTLDCLSSLGSSSKKDNCNDGLYIVSQYSRPPKIRSSWFANPEVGGLPVGIIREIAINGNNIQQSIFSVHASVSMVAHETSVANGSRNTTARSKACKSLQNSTNAGLASSFLTEMSRFGNSSRNCSSESDRSRSFSTNTSWSKGLSCISKAILGDPLCNSQKSS